MLPPWNIGITILCVSEGPTSGTLQATLHPKHPRHCWISREQVHSNIAQLPVLDETFYHVSTASTCVCSGHLTLMCQNLKCAVKISRCLLFGLYFPTLDLLMFIFWDLNVVINLFSVSDLLVSVGRGQYVRSFNPTSGTLSWETLISHQPGETGCVIPSHNAADSEGPPVSRHSHKSPHNIHTNAFHT